MLPDNPELTRQTARESLFLAIAESRFDRIPDLGAEYKQDVQCYLTGSDGQINPIPLPELLKPLADALNYLRVVRAHQSARFRKLAVGAAYAPQSVTSKGQTVRVDA